MKKLIEYSETARINFGDLDPYGHLNAKHYLDIVGSTRLRFLESHFGLTPALVAERGYGWFLKESSIQYMRPIKGLVDVQCQSRLVRDDDGLFEVSFEVKSMNGETLHATGKLVYATVDIKTGRRCSPPQWMRDIFYVVE